jgi:hypothetical protein
MKGNLQMRRRQLVRALARVEREMATERKRVTQIEARLAVLSQVKGKAA